jgi:hypothetical protein
MEYAYREAMDYMQKDYIRFKCSCTSYLSLHLALMKDQKKSTLQFLFKSLALRPAFVFEHILVMRFLSERRNFCSRYL